MNKKMKYVLIVSSILVIVFSTLKILEGNSIYSIGIFTACTFIVSFVVMVRRSLHKSEG